MAADLQALSRRALEYAIVLGRDGVDVVARALYLFNRYAVPPGLATALSVPGAVDHELGLDDAGVASILRRTWAPPLVADGWTTYHRGDGSRPATVGAGTFKLYVSPRPREIAPAVRALVHALDGDGDALAFKVPADAWGLSRPDKLIVYFDDRAGLIDASRRLLPRVTDVPAQGVPFTAALAPGGILSWGWDPPRHRGHGEFGHSWRSWVTHRLAQHVVASDADPGADASVHALEAIRKDGVDPLTWEPAEDVWARGAAT